MNLRKCEKSLLCKTCFLYLLIVHPAIKAGMSDYGTGPNRPLLPQHRPNDSYVNLHEYLFENHSQVKSRHGACGKSGKIGHWAPIYLQRK